jgi:hypothetical protein
LTSPTDNSRCDNKKHGSKSRAEAALIKAWTSGEFKTRRQCELFYHLDLVCPGYVKDVVWTDYVTTLDLVETMTLFSMDLRESEVMRISDFGTISRAAIEEGARRTLEGDRNFKIRKFVVTETPKPYICLFEYENCEVEMNNLLVRWWWKEKVSIHTCWCAIVETL